MEEQENKLKYISTGDLRKELQRRLETSKNHTPCPQEKNKVVVNQDLTTPVGEVLNELWNNEEDEVWNEVGEDKKGCDKCKKKEKEE